MTPAGFEPTISAGEGPQTYALDRAATGIRGKNIVQNFNRKLQGKAANFKKTLFPKSCDY